MKVIHRLPDDLVKKIAAGEVVERPASVVKELVENSLDAGANRVEIRIKDGGMKLIEVVDDGVGMGKEDLELSVIPHATSKIRTLDDLSRVLSLGFRGEALSSISAVSLFSIQSRQADTPLGQCLRVSLGEEKDVESTGMDSGTIVRVENLFENVPARRKFMKSAQTEFSHIADMVTGLALSYPQVGFTLSHNSKEYLNYPTAQTIEERIKFSLSADVADRLLRVSLQEPHLTIEGYVCRPEMTTQRPEKQYLFVNRRRIQDSYLSVAVKKAYGTLLMPRSYPLFVLFIELPADLVDVNVHPRKTEVAFVNRSSLFNAVMTAVSQALSKEDLTYGAVSNLREQESFNPKDIRFPRGVGYGSYDFSEAHSRSKDFSQASLTGGSQLPWEGLERSQSPTEIIQVDLTYLVLQSLDGLKIVDQHAAHERVLYEKFLKSFHDKAVSPSTQRLLVPIKLDLTKMQFELLQQSLETLEKVGFLFEGVDVVGIPIEIKDQDIGALLHGFIDDLQNSESLREIDDATLRTLTYLACRSAVKAGDYLSLEERKSLLLSLHECEVEYTCPHGRPVTIELSFRELEKMFKRVV